MKKKIFFITGSRAEYGLLQGLIKRFDDSNSFDLKIIVSGMHLLDQFGRTAKEIKKDGYKISIFPLFPTDLSNNLDEFEKAKSFKIDKANDYFVKVIVEGQEAQEDILPRINEVYKVEKTETKADKSVHMFVKLPFKYLNLVKLTRFLVPFRESL